MRTIKKIYSNVSRAQLVNVNGGISPFLNLYRGTQFNVHLTLYNEDLTPFVLIGNESYYMAINGDFTRLNEDVCVSDDSQFNIGGDWTSQSFPNGRISFRLDTDTEALASDIGSLPSKYYIGEVWAISYGSPVLLLQFNILMNNIAVELVEYSSSSSSESSLNSSSSSNSSNNSSSSSGSSNNSSSSSSFSSASSNNSSSSSSSESSESSQS